LGWNAGGGEEIYGFDYRPQLMMSAVDGCLAGEDLCSLGLYYHVLFSPQLIFGCCVHKNKVFSFFILFSLSKHV